jgi:excisionase family DNA binding protein
MSLDDSMAVPEVAKYLRVSVSTVYELLRAGELIGVRAKGTTGIWYVSHEAISRFCDIGAVHSARSASSNKKPRPPDQRGDANQSGDDSSGFRRKRKAPRKGWGPQNQPVTP